jgi:salicylate hydroxylase
MGASGPLDVIVAGAGIAGLTAALAFSRRGFNVRIFEQTSGFDAVGAGIQLAPNATRILGRLGVLDLLSPRATHPAAVLLKDAATLRLLSRIPLGEIAERRWNAPYLVVHRADLQAALLAAAARESSIEIITGARLTGAQPDGASAVVSIQSGEATRQERSDLVVGADGVWSSLRALCEGDSNSRFSGELAWRATIDAASEAGAALAALTSCDCVTTFLHSGFHLVAYPISAGAAFNLVAFTQGRSAPRNWANKADASKLAHSMRGTEKALRDLVEKAGPWTIWPVHTVNARRPWVRGRLALIGDAAHAMTPFAAQGAAMAIEDAETLACSVSDAQGEPGPALSRWEEQRRRRVLRVARRGALNRLAWHASGPVALARNTVLKLRGPDKLAADLDWLYGWKPPADIGAGPHRQRR